MDAGQWLRTLAVALDVPAPSDEEVEDLLAIASAAAHGVERWTAPVSCALVAASGLGAAEGRAVVERLLAAAAGPAAPGTDVDVDGDAVVSDPPE